MTTKTYDFNGSSIRVTTIDGEPWFISADACKALGLKQHAHGGYSQHLARLRPEEKQTVSVKTPIQNGGLYLPGHRGPSAALISESGLYKLVLRSDKPDALAFQDWVTREVLPSIRKTGSYELPKGQEMPLPASISAAFAEAMTGSIYLPATEFHALSNFFNDLTEIQ